MISLSKIFLDAKIQPRTGYTGVLGFAVGMVAVFLLEESPFMNKQFQLNETPRSFLTHGFGKIIELYWTQSPVPLRQWFLCFVLDMIQRNGL